MIQRIVLEKAGLFLVKSLCNAEQGINSFIIVQPFACLANHILKILIKALKKNTRIFKCYLLDYDPDTSFANIENRLQNVNH